MKKKCVTAIAVLGLVTGAGAAHADDVEGLIERIDAATQTLVVQGITFHTTERTDYDDGLKRFADLKVGQRVEVDFDYRDGRHIATEIELDER